MSPKPKLHLGILLGKPDHDPEEEGPASSGGDYKPTDGEKLAIHELAAALDEHPVNVEKACEALHSIFEIFSSKGGKPEPEEEEEPEGMGEEA